MNWSALRRQRAFEEGAEERVERLHSLDETVAVDVPPRFLH